MRRHSFPITAMIAALLILAGCARPAPESSPATKVTVTVERTGGFAGVHDTLVVAPDGHWVRTDRTGARRSGQLNDDQIRQLRALLADPRLPDEAGRAHTATNCRDAFNYELTAGTTRVSYVDCPTDADLPDVSMSIVSLLETATRG